MRDHGRGGQDRAQHEQCPAPPELGDDRAGERHEDGAGEPRDEGEQQQRPLGPIWEATGDDRHGGLVEHAGHRHADPRLDQVEAGHRLDGAPRDHQRDSGRGAGRHDGASPTGVDPAANDRCRDHGRQQGEGIAAADDAAARVELLRQRVEEHRKGVVEDPPRHRLGDREGRRHPPVAAQVSHSTPRQPGSRRPRRAARPRCTRRSRGAPARRRPRRRRHRRWRRPRSAPARSR